MPEETIMNEWAKNNNLANLSFKDLCANSEVKQVILKDLELQAKAGVLKGFEKVILIKIINKQKIMIIIS